MPNKKRNLSEDNGDMVNLKKAALNITSRFGLLNTHRPLVVAISEERQAHETLLKLILTRVNAGTSILRWAKSEENQELKNSMCRLYDINLMWAQVQREYAEKSNALGMSLKEILQVEAGLDALRKNLKDVSEKREKLSKSHGEALKKKGDHNSSPVASDELEKLIDEEEELTSELDVKNIKAEIFKSTGIKKSLTTVMDANLELARKMQLIFTTAKLVLEEIPDVPSHLKERKNGEPLKENESADLVSELAASLNIQRSLSSTQSTSEDGGGSAVFHVGLHAPHHSKPNSPNTPETAKKPVSAFKKVMTKLGLERPLPVPPNSKHSQFVDDDLQGFVMVSNIPPPTQLPPPIPRNDFRRRHGYCEPWEYYASHGLNDDFKRERSNTDYPVTTRDSKHEYERPFEMSKDDTTKYGYSRAYDHKKPSVMEGEIYNEPLDFIGDNSYADLHRGADKNNDEDEFYSVPYDTYKTRHDRNSNNQGDDLINEPKYMILEKEKETQKEEEEEVFQSLYQNPTEVAKKIAENQHVSKILSKPDASNHHIVIEAKSPIPAPRVINRASSVDVPEVKNQPVSKKISCPVVPSNYDRKENPKKKLPPKPLPRPRSTFYEEPAPLLENEPISKVNVKDMAIQLKGKIRPVTVVPTLTQNTLKSSEYAAYRNDLQFP
ncbi:uncharacterized protein LOC130636330 isoform X2 [Hydractinia symbiolongicarpus]|uniref:uncharacterized protein LOC130636330 isoform X2 n=1 Tax=Hydractinia symbiolongicarpus TaxID=13093 RepID=UPI002550D6B3|nr:uncharacterized protein LOC130636330 isoform X2 [Hydractinia symbiolongicarpus]